MRFVFLDTAGLLAVWDESDQWHEQACPVYEALLVEDFVPVTTPYVLAECANAAARRSFRRDVVALRDQLSFVVMRRFGLREAFTNESPLPRR